MTEWWEEKFPEVNPRTRAVPWWIADYGDVKLRYDERGFHIQIHPGHRLHIDRKWNQFEFMDAIPCQGCSR